MTSLKADDEVQQRIDWSRRFDHMQQHSGQHLISALFEQKFNYVTKAWWLGSDSSYIDIEGQSITDLEMKEIEDLCNKSIRDSLKVKVEIFEKPEDAGEDVTRASRGLPIDLAGPIRVINIEGVDANMCCGTHVKNLSELQVIKLMGIEKSKGKVLVHFLVGNRVIRKLEESYKRELELNVMLK